MSHFALWTFPRLDCPEANGCIEKILLVSSPTSNPPSLSGGGNPIVILFDA